MHKSRTRHAEGAAPPEPGDAPASPGTASPPAEASPAAAPEGDAPRIDELRKELAMREQELSRQMDRLIRLQADFENFRKHTEREREELRRTAGERLVVRLLDVLDNLERALERPPADERAREFVQGIGMIRDQFAQALAAEGLAEVECLGRPFDPLCHEAIERVCGGTHACGTVAGVFQKGYRLNGKVVRYPKVRVAVPEPPGGGAASTADAEGTKEE